MNKIIVVYNPLYSTCFRGKLKWSTFGLFTFSSLRLYSISMGV